MAWLQGALAALCVAIGGLHLYRVGRLRGDRLLEVGYAAMALGMAGMYSPLGDPVPAAAWATLFLLGGGWFLGVLLRERSVAALGGEAGHLVVGSAAMLFMLAADHQAGGVGGVRGMHPAHAVDAPATVAVASAIALVGSAYFVLHTLRCVDRLRAARHAGPGAPAAAGTLSRTTVAVRSPASLCAPPLAAGAHLLMTATMAVMLVGLI